MISLRVSKDVTSLISYACSHLRAAVKMAIFVTTLLAYFAFTLPFYPFVVIGRWERARLYLIHSLKNFCRFGLWFMNVNVRVSDPKNLLEKFDTGLIVSNHLSYMDVLILFAHRPACFVTSVEIKKTPFLGQLCVLAGCLFVDRRSRDNLSQEISELTRSLRAGLNVVIFPEATSTNGQEVLRFRRPLFQSALDAKVATLALALNYKKLADAPIHRNNRDQICWYGDMTFIDHLWGFFRLKSVEAEIVVADFIGVSELGSKEELSERSFHSVQGVFEPIR